MSSSECSLHSASGRQENVLYKVFINRGGPKNPTLDKDQVKEMFATVAEPFKVNVHRSGEYGFAYFGSKRHARACVNVFNKQPPYYYKVIVGKPEEVLMDENDLKKLNLDLKKTAARLGFINMKMRELRLEKSKLTKDLALSDYFGSDTDLDDITDITSDIMINLNNSDHDLYLSDTKDNEIRIDKKRLRAKSRSRIAEYLPQRDKSEHRRNKSEHRRDKSEHIRDKSEHRHEKFDHGRNRSLHRQQNSNSSSKRQTRYSMSMQDNSNAQNKNKNTRHSIATTSSNDYQKSSTNIQQRISRASLTNKENIRSFPSKNQNIPVEAVPADRFVQELSSHVSSHYNSRQQNNKKLFDKSECIINSLSLSHRGTLKLKTIIDSGTCVAQLSIMGDGFSNYAEAIQNIWEKYPTDYIEPVIGELVCVENDADEGWSRGYVINKLNTSNGYRIALIDDGIYVNNVTKCCKLLPEHLRIPDFACLCNVNKILCDHQKFTKLFSRGKTYGFVITAMGVDGITNAPYVKCILKDRKTKEDFCELKLSSWILSMKQDFSHVDFNINCLQIEDINDHPSLKTNYKQNEVFESITSNSNRNYNQTRAFDSTIDQRERKDFNNQKNYNRNNNLTFGNQQNSNTSYKEKKYFDNQQTNNSHSFDNHQRSKINYSQNIDCDNQQTYNKTIDQTNHKQKQFVDDEQIPIQPNTSTSQAQSFSKYDGIIPKVNLQSQLIVMIALVESQNTLFVKYRESGQHLKKVTELIQSSVSKLEAMNTKLAKIGKCIAAQFSEDQQWYRCEILSINNDTNTAVILYIDYGNKEEVKINETKMLSQTLLDIPRAVVEIKLRDLPNEPLTLAQAKYLNQCMESKTKYEIILDALHRDVQLVNSHENFNHKLLTLNSDNTKKRDAELPKQVETVLPKKVENKLPNETEKVLPKDVIEEDIKSKSRFSENISIPSSSCKLKSNQLIQTEHTKTENKTVVDMTFVELPLGKTKLIFNKVCEPKERLIVCYPDDCDYLRYIQETLTLEIFDYLQKNDNETSYKPNDGDPCIAKYEDFWYRALCLIIDNDDDSALVMFVDFGNSEKVKFTDIRKIPEQFLKDSAIAIICSVQDVPLDLNADDFSNSFNQLETYEVDVVEKEDELQYKIRISGISTVN